MSQTRAISLASLTAAAAVTFALLLGVSSMATTEVAPAWMAKAPVSCPAA